MASRDVALREIPDLTQVSLVALALQITPVLGYRQSNSYLYAARTLGPAPEPRSVVAKCANSTVQTLVATNCAEKHKVG